MENRTKTIRIIGTSDLHGRMVGWDYALNASSPDGSAAKLASALKEYRNENTLLVDAGDTVQDNSAELFIGEGVHPMIQAVNAMNYDVCVTGNHDYDYGMDVLKQIISDLNAKVLTGNVHRKDGTPLADGYTIFTIDGVRIAVIGMVTPIIARTSAQQLKGWVVTDPLEETRKIIDQLKGSYDVLIGVFHLGVKRENGLVNSGMDDILVHCPEFDAVLSSHEHKAIPELYINDVLVMQNRSR